MRLGFALAALPLLLAACGPEMAEQDAGGRPARNVDVKEVKPQHLEVKIKLPVVTRPVEEFELRAAVAGRIGDLTFDKGDRVEASSVPAAQWVTADEFVQSWKQDTPPTDEQINLRNLRHLQDVPYFARIEDSALVQSFLEMQARFDQAVRDLKRLEEYRETTGSQLDQARTQRETARAGALRVLSQIEDARVCSPVSGVVTERVRKQGEYVNPGELIARVAVMQSLRADLELPESHYTALAVGDAIDVTLPSLKNASGEILVMPGRVARKDTLAHPQTHSFTVEIELDNTDLALPAGIFGTVEVTTYSREDAFVVPLSAIKLNGEEKSLFVRKGELARELKNIRIGQLTMQSAEILGDSLKAGDQVITTGAQWLSDNDPVNVVSDDPAA